MVASWITKLETPWEAMLTYRFALPEKDVLMFCDGVEHVESPEEYWRLVRIYLARYVSWVYGGDPINSLTGSLTT